LSGREPRGFCSSFAAATPYSEPKNIAQLWLGISQKGIDIQCFQRCRLCALKGQSCFCLSQVEEIALSAGEIPQGVKEDPMFRSGFGGFKQFLDR